MNRLSPIFSFLSLLSVALLAGCNSTQSTPEASVATPLEISKGLDVVVLKERLGEPTSMESYGDVEGVEVWYYERNDQSTELVSTELKEVPYVDPISGEMKSIYDNVMSPETTVTKSRIMILVGEGKVLAWKMEESEDRHRAN